MVASNSPRRRSICASSNFHALSRNPCNSKSRISFDPRLMAANSRGAADTFARRSRRRRLNSSVKETQKSPNDS